MQEELLDDGLPMPEVGSWSEEKYELVRYQADIFTKAMTGKFTLVYVDLFAAGGRARIKTSGRIVLTSAALVLRLQRPFGRYVFCEIDPPLAEALRVRSKRDAPTLDVRVLNGDTNALVGDVITQIPKGSLTLCFVDPFNVKDFRFETLRRLAQGGGRRVDFLLLIASGMDANRAMDEYVKPGNPTIDRFLGSSEWRNRWPHERLNFGDFVTDEFGHAMKRLGYIYEGLHQTKTEKNTKNSPIYRLAYFSRHEVGMNFWLKSLRGTDPQRDLF